MSKRSRSRVWLAAWTLGALGGGAAPAQPPGSPPPTGPAAQRVPLQGPVMPWPAPIPARTRIDPDDDLIVTILGDVRTPLADATYDPAADRLTRADGTAIENYYREALGIPNFRPIDKTIHPLPPSGWSSQPFYGRQINAGEVMANAHWLSRNLRWYGGRVVLIGDGWQGDAPQGPGRDWATVSERFGDMAALAEELRKLNLLPGLWLTPHSHSSEPFARVGGVFLQEGGEPFRANPPAGPFLVDPTRPRALEHLSGVLTQLHGWGYSLFHIDGQAAVLDEFRARQPLMEGKRPDGQSPEQWAEALYRQTLEAIRAPIGADGYLLAGSAPAPPAAAGLVNGARLNGDPSPGWEGFLGAVDAAQGGAFLHNILWHSDPGPLLLRQPIPDGTARSWATLLGLSGQVLLSGDRLPDLPASRADLLKRTFPAVDIRPLDLARLTGPRRSLWDLKVAHLGRSYDVVGVFNYGDRERTRLVSWSQLGLDPARRHHVYDYWRGLYLGCFEAGVFVDIPPRDVRVLTIMAEDPLPVLLSTTRHITQGWVDVVSLERLGPETAPVLRGRSRLIAGEPYVLTFAMPAAAKSFIIGGASIGGERIPAGQPPPPPVEVRVSSGTGWGTVTLYSPVTQEASWQVDFERGDLLRLPLAEPAAPAVRPAGITGAEITWTPASQAAAAYDILVDGKPVGSAPGFRASLSGLDPHEEHAITIRPRWWDGSTGAGATVRYRAPLPDPLSLVEIPPLRATQSRGTLALNTAVDGRPLYVAGERFERGLGTHADSSIVYDLGGAYIQFESGYGLDDGARPAGPVSAVFEVWGDGKLIWKSEPVEPAEGAKRMRSRIAGVRRLELRVTSATGSVDHLHANWLDPILTVPGQAP
ncbi:MAG: NPCBM/NEW2 domain-containing protein [Phycisphaerales bacterium]